MKLLSYAPLIYYTTKCLNATRTRYLAKGILETKVKMGDFYNERIKAFFSGSVPERVLIVAKIQ